MQITARPADHLSAYLAELHHYRELLFMIVYRDIRVRYKQTVMGFFWAILMPSMIVLAGIVVRFGMAYATATPVKTSDLASVAVRSLPWAFFVSALRFATSSLVSNEDLVTKIYFPKEIIPLSAVVASSFDSLIAATLLTVVLLFIGTPLTWCLLWVPFLVLMLFMLVAGIALIASAASLFFRDVKYLVEVLLTFGIFFTPVFYKAQTFGAHAKYFMFNPLTPIIEGLDGVIISGVPPDLGWIGYSVALALAACFAGYMFFKRLEPLFAELV